MNDDQATKERGFNQVAVDAVEDAIGTVIDPAPPEKQKVAIEPGSESGLRHGPSKIKKPSTKKPKRTPLL